jgi:hypothetical protein
MKVVVIDGFCIAYFLSGFIQAPSKVEVMSDRGISKLHSQRKFLVTLFVG